MKTQIELSGMTVKSLRDLAATLKVKGYGKIDKIALVNAILEAQEPQVVDEEFTDSKLSTIIPTDRVRACLGSKTFEGVITSCKILDGEQYVHILLDGQDKTKMFHTGDVTFVSHAEPVTKTDIHIQEGGVHTFIAAEVVGEEIDEKEMAGNIVQTEVAVAPKTEKKSSTMKSATHKTTVAKSDAEVDAHGFKMTKYQEQLKGVDTFGFRKGDMVEFTVSPRSKKNPGAKLVGELRSFIWDTQDNGAYFGISVDGETYFKKPNAVLAATRIEEENKENS